MLRYFQRNRNKEITISQRNPNKEITISQRIPNKGVAWVNEFDEPQVCNSYSWCLISGSCDPGFSHNGRVSMGRWTPEGFAILLLSSLSRVATVCVPGLKVRGPVGQRTPEGFAILILRSAYTHLLRILTISLVFIRFHIISISYNIISFLNCISRCLLFHFRTNSNPIDLMHNIDDWINPNR